MFFSKIFGKKYKYGTEIEEFEISMIRKSYYEFCHILDSPLDNLSDEILHQSNEIVSAFEGFDINKNELVLDAEWFLLMKTKEIDSVRLTYLSDENIKELLHMQTIKEIAFKIFQKRNVSEDREKRLIRFSANRKNLLDEKGIVFPPFFLHMNDTKKFFLGFVALYYLNEKNFEHFIYNKAPTEVHDIFRHWEDKCIKNHFYFLCAMENPVGEYLRGEITIYEMKKAVNKFLKMS